MMWWWLLAWTVVLGVLICFGFHAALACAFIMISISMMVE